MTMLHIDPSDLIPRSPADYAAIRRRLYNPQAAAVTTAKRAVEVARAKEEAAELQRQFETALDARAALAARARAALPPKHRKADAILREVATAYGLKVNVMIGESRTQVLVRARHEAMYRIAVELPDVTYTLVAKYLGRNDHTTVLSGIRCHCRRHGLAMLVRLSEQTAERRKAGRVERLESIQRMREWSRG